ncbi:MAG: phenylalanine--tRNA ligase beta subunit-related protein [Candidatus Diapherotrites archaeon]|nr:phenylalanine--tRNA ligase beta subunit-related protein [Candidatus Diapherotrites archaeon]
MKFKVDKKVFEKFPELQVGLVVLTNVENSGIAEEVLDKIRLEESRIKRIFSAETLSQSVKIDSWRKAYISFGGEPKKNKPSLENLYRQILTGTTLRHINKLVDLYNYISLKHMLPVGGEDTEKTSGNIELCFAGPSEKPVLLLGDKEERPPHEGEIIYKDEISAICRRFNWREADRTKLTEKTKTCILVLEALPPTTRKELEYALVELQELAEKFCSAEASSIVIDSKNPEIDF